jgi:hypothetical protein
MRMSSGTGHLTNKRSWEIWRKLCDTVPPELSPEECKRLETESEDREIKNLERKQKNWRRAHADYQSDPPSIAERLPVAIDCLAYHDISLEERIDLEMQAKKYKSGIPGVDDDEIRRFIRGFKIHNAKQYSKAYGADFDDVRDWMRNRWAGIPEQDVKLTLDEAIRRELAIEIPTGAIYDNQRRYEVTERGRQFNIETKRKTMHLQTLLINSFKRQRRVEEELAGEVPRRAVELLVIACTYPRRGGEDWANIPTDSKEALRLERAWRHVPRILEIFVRGKGDINHSLIRNEKKWPFLYHMPRYMSGRAREQLLSENPERWAAIILWQRITDVIAARFTVPWRDPEAERMDFFDDTFKGRLEDFCIDIQQPDFTPSLFSREIARLNENGVAGEVSELILRVFPTEAQALGIAENPSKITGDKGPLHAPLSPAAEDNAWANFNSAERDIIQALGTKRMTGEVLAQKAGYPFNSNFKSTLASLKKRGILDNKNDKKGRGYELVHKVLICPDNCQD